MNFFDQQDRARRKTALLVGLLCLAVVSLILMTALALGTLLYFGQQPIDSPNLAHQMHIPWGTHMLHLLGSEFMLYASFAVLVVVGCGSAFKFVQLGGNGRRVAEALGGRMIVPNTQDPHERQVLNVVEEMAIASGNPVPVVYLLDEPAINAFAAGTDRRNAVIGVTRGCIQRLNRDELQGVIAHEFSHIHYGDMRLNLRLVAILHGILVIGLIGSYLLRSSAYRGRSKNQGALVGAGLAFFVLGYCGVFFGNIIKSAVSRQREYLADAAAVQFTRNPDGIANALKKIGGLSEHALLETPTAAEYSHMYFGQGVRSGFGGLMATHPPLEQRIRRIVPRWDGKMLAPQVVPVASPPPKPDAQFNPGAGMGAVAAAAAMAAAVADVGNPTKDHLDNARALLDTIPQQLIDDAHDPFMARALIYSLLLDPEDPAIRDQQIAYLRDKAHPVTFRTFEQRHALVRQLARSQYLPLVELAMPALRNQSPSQYQVFKRNLMALIKADGEVSLLEWCLYRIVVANCEELTAKGTKRLHQCREAVETLLAATCHSNPEQDIDAAFAAAGAHLPSLPNLNARQHYTAAQLEAAVKQLEQLRPLEKPPLLKALAACIQADGQVTAEEMELFRAVADCLDCPVPLLTVS